MAGKLTAHRPNFSCASWEGGSGAIQMSHHCGPQSLPPCLFPINFSI
jgi:hypothetical protein